MNDVVMLLIDADNVSIDVMEQAVEHLLAAHGAVHLRRAYCTAESAVKHQAAFKRLSIKPMVNLAAGKNSTDIALAVDAIDLVLAERPDIVAIASSDSDFAPLVARLREKGCRVVGIGQDGKTGDETRTVYDAYTEFAHRAATAPARRTPTRKTAAKKAAAPAAGAAGGRGAKTAAAKKTPARKAAARKTAAKTADAAVRDAAEVAPSAAAAAPADGAPAADTAPPAAGRSRATSRSRPTRARSSADDQRPDRARPGEAAQDAVPAAPHPAASAARAGGAADGPARIDRILELLPELGDGRTLELGVAAKRLRDAGLLTKSAPSTKLFASFADRFELLPAGQQPNRVRLR